MSTDKHYAGHGAMHKEMRNIIEETRVILPGIQALFGFQTIVVFNDRFAELPEFAKDCHLLSLSAVIIAVALIVTPAVYYRYVGYDYVSPPMLSASTRMIRTALACLAIGLSLDMFTVIFTATTLVSASIIGAVITFVLLVTMWFAFPMAARRAARRRGVTSGGVGRRM
jgi:membrane-associated HD superfamily phosphohydrolase